jgi:hypothetical protein
MRRNLSPGGQTWLGPHPRGWARRSPCPRGWGEMEPMPLGAGKAGATFWGLDKAMVMPLIGRVNVGNH